MEGPAHDFLRKILETPSPSGYDRPVQEFVRGISPLLPIR